MSTFQDIIVFILDTIFSLFLVMVLLRFFLQTARADFYNPFSQSIVKITNPLLIPVRRIVPGVFGIDFASILLAILTQFIYGELVALILTGSIFNPLSLLIWGILALLNLTIYIGFALILILVISSFVAPYSSHPILMLVRQLTEPVLAPVRKVIPPIGGLDFSVMCVGMLLVIFQKILTAIAYELRIAGQLVIGI